MRLTANKSFKYGTRRLEAGDEFEAVQPYVRTMLLTGLAREPNAELDELRQRAMRLGITIDRRWGVKRLKDRLGEHGG